MKTEKTLFNGRLIQLVEQSFLLQGREVTYELARRAPGVRLLIASQDKASILLTREYRSELNAYDYRLPGGKVFDTLKEYSAARNNDASIEAAAATKAVGEGAEEAGLAISEVSLYRTSVCGSTIEWDLYFYEVIAFEDTGVQALEAGEDITVNWFPVAFAFQMALSGQMRDERSAAVFMQWLYAKGVRPW